VHCHETQSLTEVYLDYKKFKPILMIAKDFLG